MGSGRSPRTLFGGSNCGPSTQIVTALLLLARKLAAISERSSKQAASHIGFRAKCAPVRHPRPFLVIMFTFWLVPDTPVKERRSVRCSSNAACKRDGCAHLAVDDVDHREQAAIGMVRVSVSPGRMEHAPCGKGFPASHGASSTPLPTNIPSWRTKHLDFLRGCLAGADFQI